MDSLRRGGVSHDKIDTGPGTRGWYGCYGTGARSGVGQKAQRNG